MLIRMLSENGALQSPTGRIAIGWLVVEDIFTVFVLVLLPAMFGYGIGNQRSADGHPVCDAQAHRVWRLHAQRRRSRCALALHEGRGNAIP